MIPGSVYLIYYTTGGYKTEVFITAAIVGALFAALVASLLILRRFVCPRGNEKPRVPVWDCGYDNPTSRMAYTATAFTQPLADLLQPLLNIRRHIIAFKGEPSNPSDAAIATETDDIAIKGFWRPIFTYVARIFQMIHLLQNGSLHFYILIKSWYSFREYTPEIAKMQPSQKIFLIFQFILILYLLSTNNRCSTYTNTKHRNRS
jgi:hypothetical protein